MLRELLWFVVIVLLAVGYVSEYKRMWNVVYQINESIETAMLTKN